MKIVVIKCGGSILDELTPSFFESIKNLMAEGYKPVFVHGGGPAINQMLTLLDVKYEFHNGLRKTNKQVMQTVELVLSGQTNRQLVQYLNEYGITAIGVNGSDGKFLEGKMIDKELLGYVGEITSINIELIHILLEKDFLPVITPIAITQEGEKLNVNADHAAASIASALNAERCLFVTDVAGVIIDGVCLSQLKIEDIDSFISSGDIYGGMIPKVQSAASVVNKGIKGITIVSGKEVFFSNRKWFGTNIVVQERVI